jgi:hypothetical protein
MQKDAAKAASMSRPDAICGTQTLKREQQRDGAANVKCATHIGAPLGVVIAANSDERPKQ